MKVADLMCRSFQSIAAEAAVRHAVRMMGRLDTPAIPVHEGATLVGMVSRAAVARSAAAHADTADLPVRRLMTALQRCYEDQEAGTVACLMDATDPGVVVVFDREDRPVGWLRADDLDRAA